MEVAVVTVEVGVERVTKAVKAVTKVVRTEAAITKVVWKVVDMKAVREARARRHSYWSFVLLHLRIRTSWISYMWLEHSAPYGRSM